MPLWGPGWRPSAPGCSGCLCCQCVFSADLDYAGLQILASLREVFPEAQAWWPSYGDLAERLSAGDGNLL